MSTPLNVAEELLGPNVNLRGQRTALWYDDTCLTWQELAGQVNRVGNFLKEAGLRPRDMVVIQLPDEPLCVSAFLGAIQAGIWPVMVSPDLGKNTLEYILRDSQAAALMTRSDYQGTRAQSEYLRRIYRVDEEAFQARLAAAPDSLAPYPSHAGDIAFLLYTSGSTGNPKGVPHRHRDMLACADSFGKEVLHITDQDVHFSASKLFFAFGLGNSLFLPFRFGAAAILFPGKPTPQEVLHLLATRRPTVFFSVPSFYSLLIKSWGEGFRVDSLRLCVSAGEALPATVYQEWRRRTGVELVDGLGSTEALHIVISNLPGQVRPGSSGFLVPGYKARMVGDDGRPVAGGQPGSLFIRGPSTAPYYWNLPEETARTMSPDGWVRTGDIYTEEGGCFTYQGRADDLFKVDAHWVAPIQVEAVLREHPAVRDCAVTGRKLESLVKPQAHVVLNGGYAPGLDLEKELRFHVLEKLPDYMCPVQIHFCQELPRTETGKIQRFRLRESSLPLHPRAGSEAALSGNINIPTQVSGKKARVTAVELREVMKQAGILESVIAKLKDDVPLLEQGFDSMDLPALAAAAEKWYGIDLSDADPTVLQTVNEFVAYLNGKLP